MLLKSLQSSPCYTIYVIICLCYTLDITVWGGGAGGRQGPNLTLNLVEVFINFVHQNGPIFAGMGTIVLNNGTNQFLVKFYPILM